MRTGKTSGDIIDPPPDTDVKNVFGKHQLHGYFKAQIYNDGNTRADISVKFMVQDYYDFEATDEVGNPKGLSVYAYGIGRIPHQWLLNLKKAQRAAEFDYYAIWSEHLTVDKTYKVQWIPNYSVPGWPTKPPAPGDDEGAILVRSLSAQGKSLHWQPPLLLWPWQFVGDDTLTTLVDDFSISL